jgi:hypothetical protein
VVQHVVAVATGVLKCVGEDGEAVERTLGVDAGGEGDNRRGQPFRFDGDGVEGVPHDAPKQCGITGGRNSSDIRSADSSALEILRPIS